MAWNRTLPANNSKIRLSPSYIRDNWDAIETGLVPFDFLQLQQQAADPATTATTGWLFSKNSAGVTELFYKDPSANVIQMTSVGRIGSSTTNVIFNDAQFTRFTLDGTYYYTALSLITAKGTVHGDGSVSQGDGITCTRTGAGFYTVIVAAGRLQNSKYQAAMTSFQSDTGAHTTILNIVQAPNVNPALPTNILVEVVKRDGGTHIDAGFDVIIVGGR